MTTTRLLLVLALALGVGCSALTPYATYPVQPKPGAPDPRQRVAICFNKFKTTSEQVQELAQAECPKESNAELLGVDYVLDYCPMTLPGRASFGCTPKK